MLGANPMASVVQGFRWGLVGGAPPQLGPALVSAALVAVALVGGLLAFNRKERTFADEI